MVKLGFIVEGVTEKIILEKSDFFNYLRSLNIDFVDNVVNAGGIGNLLPHRITEHTQILIKQGATRILILADLDNDACITVTKNRIKPLSGQILVISVKKIEAWFLSDTESIRKFIKKEDYACVNPELIEEPFTEIRTIRGRAIRSKPALAESIILKGFSILKAAEHPNCNSAKYFLKKITELSTLQTL